MAEEINARIRHVGKTQAEWLADNTVLLAGELGYATDTQVIKIGNGQDTWRDLKSHQGEQGPKGEPFTYEDLTEEQRLEIRGAEIDTSGFVSRTELNEAIENVDVSDQLDSKADVNHTHEIDDVKGLQASLDGKAGIAHTHMGLETRLGYLEADVKGLDTILNTYLDSFEARLDSFEARVESLEKLAEEPKIKQMTQSEYDGLLNKDSNILYVVVE